MIIKESDFTMNYKKFENILQFKDDNFILEVKKQINKTALYLLKLVNKYNDTIMKQIKIAKVFEKFNFNITEFNDSTNSFLAEIEFNFNNIMNNIKNISNDYIFNNALKRKMESLYDEKSNNFKNFVKELSRLYEIKPFNLTFDLDKVTENIIKKIYDKVVFKFIYDYMDAYELNKETYIKYILELIEIKKRRNNK